MTNRHRVYFLLFAAAGWLILVLAHPILGGLWVSKVGSETERMNVLVEIVLNNNDVSLDSAPSRLDPAALGAASHTYFEGITYLGRRESPEIIVLEAFWRDTTLLTWRTGDQMVVPNAMHPAHLAAQRIIGIASGIGVASLFGGIGLFAVSFILPRIGS